MTSAVCRDCTQIFEAAGDRCPDCGSVRIVAHRELADLAIAHIDCDAFYASVEKRDDPSLNGKPVIVGHSGGRGVVTTACYIARKFGICSAMPMFKALQACPDAIVIRPDMAKYKHVSNQLRDIFRAATPVIEPISLDEAYLDLRDDVRRDHRRVPSVLADIAGRVEREIGITVSIGLSANKFLAKLASDLQKPRGFSAIGAREASSFLGPLPVHAINGVGAATARRMKAVGINTIGDLQRWPESELIARFGKFGRRLAGYAHGWDDRKVTAVRHSKSISAETTFRTNTSSADDLKAAAERLCVRVAERLDRSELAAVAVVVKLKTWDFRLQTRRRQLPNPTRRAEVLHRAAAPIIDREADGRAFRLIGIAAIGIVPATQADPPDLFDP